MGGGFMSDIDAAEEWLDSWGRQVNARAERSVGLSRRVGGAAGLGGRPGGGVAGAGGCARQVGGGFACAGVAALTGSAESRDGAIRVTVGSTGQVERLDLDDRVRELSGPRLAQEIMSVMRRAQAALSIRVAGEVRATVGEDTETGRAVIHS